MDPDRSDHLSSGEAGGLYPRGRVWRQLRMGHGRETGHLGAGRLSLCPHPPLEPLAPACSPP